MRVFSSPRILRALGLILVAVLVLSRFSGCRAVLATMAYMIVGNDVPAEFNGLKEKKVVVVCRSSADMGFSGGNAANEIAGSVSEKLKRHVKKIQIVDPREVANWTDEHNWNDFSEIGEALEADMVVGIDLDGFRLRESHTVYQGHAGVKVTVLDMKDDGKQVFEKPTIEVVYPEVTPIDSSAMSEDEFRRAFVEAIAKRVGVLFHPHDANLEFARNGRSDR